MMTTTTPEQPHDTVESLTSQDWKVISETSAGIQLERPKQWNKLGVWITVLSFITGLLIFPILHFVGFVFLILTVGDYLLTKPQTKLIKPS